ncbi:MAG: hypothetical protein INQ03_07035 [Candidatus Heimdallarchaeota archaeon]|nr:hypothetical protein [Candidatus Heimdallarchaeota archaeon]
MSKTKKKRIDKQDNSRAINTYMFLTGILIWMSIIASAVAIKSIISKQYNLLAVSMQLLLTALLIIGLLALIYKKYPFHYLILVGAMINLVFSFFAAEPGVVQFAISFLILYLGIRFPVYTNKDKVTFKK